MTPGLEGRLPGLASCQEYEVSVTAVQYSVAKPGGRARPSLWTADQIVMMGWAGVAYGEQYSLYRRHPASDSWTTEATQLQVPAERCSEFIYAVTVTVDGEESGKVEAAGSIVTEVNTEELPVMIVEEKANGSMTFVLKTGEVNTMCEVSFDTIHYSVSQL